MSKKKNTLLRNTSILMAATIISRVIGLLYRSPLGETIGNEGLGYYSTASNLYTILLLISSYSIPMAVSKIVSERLALKEYRNAHRVFHGALIYAVIVGGIAALVAFFGGKFLLPYNQQNATPCLTRTGADHLFLGCSRCSARLFPGPQHDDADLNFTDHRAGIQRRIQYWRRLVLHPAVRGKRYRTCQIRCRRRNPRNRSRCPGRPLLYADRLRRKPENNSAESCQRHTSP